MKFNITAPEAGYEGTVGKVRFTDGKAVIDEDTNPSELAYCRTAGYLVEEADEPKADEPEKAETKSAPARRAPAKKGEDQ